MAPTSKTGTFGLQSNTLYTVPFELRIVRKCALGGKEEIEIEIVGSQNSTL